MPPISSFGMSVGFKPMFDRVGGVVDAAVKIVSPRVPEVGIAALPFLAGCSTGEAIATGTGIALTLGLGTAAVLKRHGHEIWGAMTKRVPPAPRVLTPLPVEENAVFEGIGDLREMGFVGIAAWAKAHPESIPVAPESLKKAVLKFFEFPSEFVADDLIKEIVKAGYPNQKDAAWQYKESYSLMQKGTLPPFLPLKNVPFVAAVLREYVKISYPTGKYSFVADFAQDIARSDDPAAHATLVRHILTPFPEGNTHAFDGPDELGLKRRWIREITSAISSYGTPESNPLAKRDLMQIYDGVSPPRDGDDSLNLYRTLAEKVGSDDKYQRDDADRKMASLRAIRIELVGVFARSGDPELRGIAADFFSGADARNNDVRLLVLDILKVPEKADPEDLKGFIRSSLVGPTNEAAARLFYNAIGAQEPKKTELLNAAIASLVRDEIQKYSVGEIDSFDFAAGALKRFQVSRDNPAANDFLNEIVAATLLPSFRRVAAWQLAEGLEYATLPDQTAKSYFLNLVAGAFPEVLAPRSDYDWDNRVSIFDAAVHLESHQPDLLQALTSDELIALRGRFAAYRAYRQTNPAGSYDSMEFGIKRLEAVFEERRAELEVKTIPDKYARWFAASLGQHVAYYQQVDLGRDNQPSWIMLEAGRGLDAVMQKLKIVVPADESSPANAEAVVDALYDLYTTLTRHHDLSYNSTIWQKLLPFLSQAGDYLPEEMKAIALQKYGRENQFLAQTRLRRK